MPVNASNRHKVDLRLEQELSRLRRALRLRGVLAGLAAWIALAGAAGATLYLVYPLTAGNLPLLGLLVLGFGILAVGSLVQLVLRPLFRRISFDRLLAEIETRSPELRDRLSTALYLYRSDEVDRYGFSPDLSRSTIAYAETRAGIGEVRRHFSWRPMVAPAAWAAMVLVLFAMFLLLPAPWLGSALTGYRTALLGRLPMSSPIRFATSGDMYVRRGQPVEVGARVFGWTGASLSLEVIGPDGPGPLLAGERRDATTVFTLPPMMVDQQYRVYAMGHASRAYHLTVLTPPKIVEWKWSLRPPEYMGQPTEALTTPANRVAARVGSWGDLVARSNWPLVSVAAEGNLLNVEVSRQDPRTVLGAMEFRAAGDVELVLRDIYGQVSTVTLEVSLVPDRPPEVALSFPPRMFHPPDKAGSVNVEWTATDDYGVSGVRMMQRTNGNEEREAEMVLYGPHVVPGTVEKTAAGVSGGFAWDLAPLSLLPGDEVSYWIEAADNRPPPDGPGVGRSAVHTLRVPSLLERYEEQFSREEARVESMQDLLEQQRELSERVRQIKDNVEKKERAQELGKAEPESAWEEQTALEEVKREEERLAREMEELRQDMARSTQQTAEERTLNMRTQEKEKQIRELLDQMLDERTKALLNQMQQAIDELAQKMDTQQMETLEMNLADYEQQLDRYLDQLADLYTERQVDELLQRAEELAEAQREISERTKDARDLGEEEQSKEELARQEEFLKEEAESLADELERLAEFNAEKNPEASEKMQEMAQEVREKGLSEDLQQAMEQLEQNEFAKSLQKQQSAQQKLDQLAGNMAEMQESIGGQDFKMDMEKVGAVARRGLFLSQRQEREVVVPLREAGQGADWSGEEQQRIGRDLDMHRVETLRLVGILEEEMADIPFVDDRALKLLTSSARNLSQAIAQSEEGMPMQVLPPAGQGLRFLNEAVLVLLESLENMQQMQQQQSMGPGGQQQDTQQQMESMAQRQRSLNQRRERMQGSPGERPGKSEMLRRMAEEQEAIRQELQGMSEQLEQSKELLGDMGEVAKEMKDVEEIMREGNPDDPRIREKQEHILDKLLEGGKSLREDDYRQERESEVAKEYPMPEILDLPKNRDDLQRGLLRRAEGLDDSSVPPRLRAPTSNYFRNLAEQL